MDQRANWGDTLVNVCLYVEGGAPSAKAEIATACRRGFRDFLKKALGDRPKPRIVASGSRDEAYRDFCRSIESDSDTFAVLLVDSEDPVVKGKTAAVHLRQREKHWKGAIPDEQVHLMVQCMEAWFLADKGALEQYYGEKFKRTALPANPKIEEVSKADVLKGLESATKTTSKGDYHKTRHGFDILARIDPSLVRQASNHANALIVRLLNELGG